MKHALAGVVMLVAASLVASCGSSSGGRGSSGSDASINDETATCGGSGEPCCNGDACENGLTCISAACLADTILSDATMGSAGDVTAGPPDVTDAPLGSEAGDASVTDASMDSGDVTGGDAGTCKSGTYSGPFSCDFKVSSDGGDAGATPADAGGLAITGTILFRLTQATGSDESFIDTASGTLSGMAGTIFSLSADVSGALNCNTGVFQGTLTNGMYGFLTLNGTFSSPLDSQYNGTSSSFVDGTWLLTIPGEGNCPGTWSADYTGP